MKGKMGRLSEILFERQRENDSSIGATFLSEPTAQYTPKLNGRNIHYNRGGLSASTGVLAAICDVCVELGGAVLGAFTNYVINGQTDPQGNTKLLRYYLSIY
jgi:hypothetical protein